MRFLPLIVFFATLNLCCSQNKEKPITELSQNDINTGILIDVRTPQEFRKGHIENAVNIDWLASDFKEKCKTLDKKTPVFVYCKIGGRSAKAAKMLDSLGFKVTDLAGGYDTYLLAREH